MTTGDYGKAFEEGFSKTVRFLISRGANPEIAEETAQAAWTRGWTRRRQLRDPHCVGTWVNSIAMNLFRNSYRTAKRNQALTDLQAATSSTLASVDVEKVLSYCRQRDCSLLKLFYLYGYTTGEIGDRVGLTSTAVRVRLLRARRTLQGRMKVHSCPAAKRNTDSPEAESSPETESLPQAA
jgi:RNA polymerase sigma factor (sigma-70 family)